MWKVLFWVLNAENLVHLTWNDPYNLRKDFKKGKEIFNVVQFKRYWSLRQEIPKHF
jgi:hypothetical protein